MKTFQQTVNPFHATVLLMAMSIGFTLLLQPLYNGVRNVIDKLFFHEYYERRLKFAQLRQELLGSDQEEEFNRMILRAIDSSFKIVRVGLFIWNEKTQLFHLQAQSAWGNPQKTGASLPLPMDHPIPQILQNNEFYSINRIAARNTLDDTHTALEEAMRGLEASLLIPIKRDRLLGFLVLGEKESGLPYTPQDIEGLKEFARLTAVVAKTEQLLESRRELEKWNQELENRVQERTSELEVAQEELLKKSRLAIIGEVVSMVSHELKNPLGVINASSYFLESRLTAEGDPLLLKHARMVSSQADSMNRIITAILDYCRSRELILREGNINDLIRDVAAVVQHPSGVQVSLQLAPIPASLFDRDELRQAMTNLISNGIEAMGENGTLTVRTKMTARDRITVEVSDTGCGIPAANLSRIFDPLFTTKSNGTGLGLAVVKKVVDRHEGTIKVDSSAGQGTLFTVNLPVRVSGRKAA